MKKIISVLLLLAMVLGCFAGCAPEAATEDAGLKAAAEYVYALYKDSKTTTDADFTVVGQVRIDDVVYPVTWTADKAENVQVVAGENGMTTIKITAAAEDVNYKLTATVKNEQGQEASVSFNFTIPAKAQVAGKTIVLAYPKENKFVSGNGDVYTSSSGSTKNQLDMTANEAEAVAMQIVENSDGTISFVAGEYYLYADGTHATFVKEQGDNTKFVLEAADTDGGYFVKCANATYNGNPQYLEVYSDNLCSYGMQSDTSIFIFKLQESTVAAGVINVDGGNSGNTDSGNSGNTGNTGNSGNTGSNNNSGSSNSGSSNSGSSNSGSSNSGSSNSGSSNSGSSSSSKYTQVSSLKSGDKVVIVNPASKMALSMTKVATYYNAGIDISGGFGSITKDEIFTVKKNSDGTYTFTSLSGKVLALADEYSSLNDTGANKNWELSSAGSKVFYLKNVARGNYLEWYASKNNWSTYAAQDLTDEFVLAFYSTSGSGSSSGNSGSSNSGSSNSGSSSSGNTGNSGSSNNTGNSGSSNSGSSSNTGNSGTTSTPAAGKGIVFDFTSLDKKGVEITADEALDLFNGVASEGGLTAVTLTKIYNGNSTGGALPNTNGFIRCGKSDADGDLVLTFSKKVAKVEVVCHDWYAKSDSYPTNSNYIAVNGSTAQLTPYNETGAGATLTFNLDGSSNVVDFDFTNSASGKTGRAFIFKIVITFVN